jgi:hypothetical protein
MFRGVQNSNLPPLREIFRTVFPPEYMVAKV